MEYHARGQQDVECFSIAATGKSDCAGDELRQALASEISGFCPTLGRILERQTALRVRVGSLGNALEELQRRCLVLSAANAKLTNANKQLDQELQNAHDETSMLRNHMSYEESTGKRATMSFDDSLWVKELPERVELKAGLSQIHGVGSVDANSSRTGSFSGHSETNQDEGEIHQISDLRLFPLGRAKTKDAVTKKLVESLKVQVKELEDEVSSLKQRNETQYAELQLKTTLLNRIDIGDICEEDLAGLIRLKAQDTSVNLSEELQAIRRDRARLEVLLRQCLQTLIRGSGGEYDAAMLDDSTIDDYETLVANITKQSVRASRSSEYVLQPAESDAQRLEDKKKLSSIQDKLTASERDRLEVQKQYVRIVELNEQLSKMLNNKIHDLQFAEKDFNEFQPAAREKLIEMKQQNHKLLYFCTQLQETVRAQQMKSTIDSQASIKEYVEANTRMRVQIDKLTVDLHRYRQKYLDVITSKISSRSADGKPEATRSVVKLEQRKAADQSSEDEEENFQTSVPQLMVQLAQKEQQITGLQEQLSSLQQKKAERQLEASKGQFLAESQRVKISELEAKLRQQACLYERIQDTHRRQIQNEQRQCEATVRELRLELQKSQATAAELEEVIRQKEIMLRHSDVKLKQASVNQQQLKLKTKQLDQKKKQASRERDEVQAKLAEEQEGRSVAACPVLISGKNAKEVARAQTLQQQVAELRDELMNSGEEIQSYKQRLAFFADERTLILGIVKRFSAQFAHMTGETLISMQKRYGSANIQTSLQAKNCIEKVAKAVDFMTLQRNTIVRQQIELRQVSHLQRVIRIQEKRLQDDKEAGKPPTAVSGDVESDVFSVYQIIAEENKNLIEQNKLAGQRLAAQAEDNARLKEQMRLLLGRQDHQ